jgi:hypothetical protein
MPYSAIAMVTTDPSGLVVHHVSGRYTFANSWVGLPIVVNGQLSSVASITSTGQMTLAQAVGSYSSPVPLTSCRETIYQAVFNILRTIPGVTTYSRSPNVFGNYALEQFPVLWMEQVGERQQEPARGLPYKWEYDVSFGVYVKTGLNGNGIPPAALLNPILDSIEDAFGPDAPTGQGQTLDGLVEEVRLYQSSRVAAGSILDTAFAWIPAIIKVQ